MYDKDIDMFDLENSQNKRVEVDRYEDDSRCGGMECWLVIIAEV